MLRIARSFNMNASLRPRLKRPLPTKFLYGMRQQLRQVLLHRRWFPVAVRGKVDFTLCGWVFHWVWDFLKVSVDFGEARASLREIPEVVSVR